MSFRSMLIMGVCVLATTAMERERLSVTVGSMPTATLGDVQIQMPPTIPDVDLNEDVPGCVDDYFRFCIGFWRISEGWFDFGSVISGSASTFLTGLATQGDLPEDQRKSLGIAAIVCGGVAFGSQVLKNYAMGAIVARRATLQQVILEGRPRRNPQI